MVVRLLRLLLIRGDFGADRLGNGTVVFGRCCIFIVEFGVGPRLVAVCTVSQRLLIALVAILAESVAL